MTTEAIMFFCAALGMLYVIWVGYFVPRNVQHHEWAWGLTAAVGSAALVMFAFHSLHSNPTIVDRNVDRIVYRQPDRFDVELFNAALIRNRLALLETNDALRNGTDCEGSSGTGQADPTRRGRRAGSDARRGKY